MWYDPTHAKLLILNPHTYDYVPLGNHHQAKLPREESWSVLNTETAYILGFWEQSGREGNHGGRAKEERGRNQNQQHGTVAPGQDELAGGQF